MKTSLRGALVEILLTATAAGVAYFPLAYFWSDDRVAFGSIAIGIAAAQVYRNRGLPIAEGLKQILILLASFAAVIGSLWWWKSVGANQSKRLYVNTRLDNALEHPMRILPTARQFFDLSFIAYSKEFAAEFGLVDSLIEKLEPGFHYVQLKAATTGSGTKCTATLVLDKDLTSALGSEDRFSSMLVSVELPFTDKSEPPVLRTPQQESAAKSLNRFAGQPLYEFNRFISLRGATAELNAKSNLDYYLASRSERMNVISLSGWCEYWLPTLSDSSARFVVSGSATGAEHFVTIPDRLRNGIFSTLEGKQLTY